MFDKNTKENILFFGTLSLMLIFLYCIKGILFPFILSIIIAFLFKNPILKLEKIGISRTLSSLFFVILIFFTIFVLMFFGLPTIFNQLFNLIKELSNYISNINLEKIILKLNELDFANINNKTDIQKNISVVYQHGIKYLGNFSNSIISYSGQVINIISMLFIAPIITFYFMRDWDKMFNNLKDIIPIKKRENLCALALKVNDTLEAFIIGQLTVCLLLGTYYAVLLCIADLKYGFILGILGGLISFLPYVGSFLTGLLALTFACFQCNFDIGYILLIGFIFVSGQFLEGNFITPRLIGNKVQLHPLWVIFSLFCGGTLFGFVGVLFALPVAGVIGVVLRFYFGKNNYCIKNG